MFDFLALAQTCAPAVHPDTMRRLVQVESSFNPYAIGVVGGRLARQPRSHAEALAAVRLLERQGMNYSVGLAQVNMKNFPAYGLSATTMFDPCSNLRAGSRILAECFGRAQRARPTERAALLAAFSCYESGNFKTGFKDGYVSKLVQADPGQASFRRPAPAPVQARHPPPAVTRNPASPPARVERYKSGTAPLLAHDSGLAF
ncbi:MAG: lytic transglycosylase domain-containing protein [Pseudomonadota bacterium]